MKPKNGHPAANLADAWLGAAAREELEQGERKARAVARRQAELDTFGPKGRPRVLPPDEEEETS